MSIKEQITTDLAVAGSKIGAAASVTAATYSPGYSLSDWALIGTIVFTVVQTFTVMVKNWVTGRPGGLHAWATSGASGRGSAAVADTTLSTKQRIGFAAAPLALIGALVAALGTNDSAHEGRRYTSYYDSAGILTVCAGITGPAVVKGKRYTDEECTRLETAYVRTMLGHMGQCVRGEFEFHEIKAWGHFAYNIGTPAFCASTAAKRLNAGERQPACVEMWKWRYVTIGGAKRDCALPQWSSKCGGIIDRRQWEMSTCQGRQQ